MECYNATVFFDFNEQYITNIQTFLDVLTDYNWIISENENLWQVPVEYIDKQDIVFTQIQIVLVEAAQKANISLVDYMIIYNDNFYFDTLI